MKKKVLFPLACVMAGTMLFSAAACGGGSEEPDAPNPPEVDAQAPAFSDAAATFTLNGGMEMTEYNQISKSLFGVFLEDINYASFLMDDNLVANGNFDARRGAKTTYWNSMSGASIEHKTQGGVLTGTQYTANGQNVNPGYVLLKATAAGGGMYNSGHNDVPMAVEAGVDYTFSAFIRADDGAEITVAVTDGTKEYASVKFTAEESTDWVKYTRTLTASESKAEGLRLAITLGGAANVAFDMVALETTDSTIGIKQYVYDAIEELSPKFIRFPGGCIAEGNGAWGEDCAFDWKNSIGAVKTGTNAGDDDVPALTYKVNTDGTTKDGAATYGEQITRTPNPNLWGGNSQYYDLDYAIGFYEYFLLCESVGASAVPVVNCGYSCQGGAASNPHLLQGRHGKGVADFIQDAKDLIYFAKGSVDSSDPVEAKWARIRTNLGHPAPFKMDYLGIGNEQFGSIYYNDCYEKFLVDFAAEENELVRSVKPIVGNGMFLENCENPESKKFGTAQVAARNYWGDGKIAAVSDYGVHDQHYYVNYTELIENTHLYDSYLREIDDEQQYYEVFVGEYSANDGGRVAGFGSYHQNELITALAEAAMMTGFERNGDVVKLAAYAPMFGSVNDAVNQWKTDMMYYTNTQIVRTANYYVQQLFMHNQGDHILSPAWGNLEVAYADSFEPTFALPADTQAPVVGEHIVDKLHYVASMMEDGTLIFKVVNVSGGSIKFNVNVSGATASGYAEVIELYSKSGDRAVKNTLQNPDEIVPTSFTAGFTGNSMGYEIKPYGLAILRINVKG